MQHIEIPVHRPHVLHLYIGTAGTTDTTYVKLAASALSKGIFCYLTSHLVSSVSVSVVTWLISLTLSLPEVSSSLHTIIGESWYQSEQQGKKL